MYTREDWINYCDKHKVSHELYTTKMLSVSRLKIRNTAKDSLMVYFNKDGVVNSIWQHPGITNAKLKLLYSSKAGWKEDNG